MHSRFYRSLQLWRWGPSTAPGGFGASVPAASLAIRWPSLGAEAHPQGTHPRGQGTAIPGPSADCPLPQGMSAQGMTAIPSLCPLLQGLGSKGWHSSPESEPLRQVMGWVRMCAAV